MLFVSLIGDQFTVKLILENWVAGFLWAHRLILQLLELSDENNNGCYKHPLFAGQTQSMEILITKIYNLQFCDLPSLKAILYQE